MTSTFIKSAIAAIAIVGSVSTASAAVNYVYLDNVQQSTTTLKIDTIRTESAGYVEIRQLEFGKPGKLLATESVQAGVNHKLKVPFGQHQFKDVVVMLFNNSGTLLDSEIVEIDN